MNDEQELIDYCDEHGNVIGQCTRQEADDKNLIYPNAIIFVFTSQGSVWLQKRAMTKRHYPGMWDTSACSGLGHGEDPKLAAQRETFEEIGLECDLELVEKFINRFASDDNSLERIRVSYLYIGICDDEPLTNHEVEEVSAHSIDEVRSLLKNQPENFVPSFDVEFEKAVKAYEALAS